MQTYKQRDGVGQRVRCDRWSVARRIFARSTETMRSDLALRKPTTPIYTLSIPGPSQPPASHSLQGPLYTHRHREAATLITTTHVQALSANRPLTEGTHTPAHTYTHTCTHTYIHEHRRKLFQENRLWNLRKSIKSET